eukprot:TRINITY_DN4294_c0_g1_i1.p1 TRINITY_DN4294_c0_g1~~TRINITY_DN4294_c0_g1_i1.p1  ORF type:complete len:309 (+),score=43.06 TRINITY_DN4294_c0_g1_i1:78-929(+)
MADKSSKVSSTSVGLKQEEFTHKGWHFRTSKRHILSSEEIEEWVKELKLPVLPEMVFGYNTIVIEKPICEGVTFSYSFNAMSALKLCIGKEADVKLLISKDWTESNKLQVEKIKTTIEKSSKLPISYDWTFSSHYLGDIHFVSSPNIQNPKFGIPEASTDVINYDRLKKQDPILAFSEIHLFEDELGDNGEAQLSVKFRVMNDYFYGLVRYYLRVDGVLFRIHDTRIFHDFDTDYILRETQHREDSFDKVKKLTHPSTYNDSNMIWNLLPVKLCKTEKITIHI